MLKLDTIRQRKKKIMQSLIRQRSNLLCRTFSVSKAMGPFVSHQNEHKLNRADLCIHTLPQPDRRKSKRESIDQTRNWTIGGLFTPRWVPLVNFNRAISMRKHWNAGLMCFFEKKSMLLWIFPEITGKDNLTVLSYSGRVKSPEWKRQLRRADLRQF